LQLAFSHSTEMQIKAEVCPHVLPTL
jgi:hypothetical protein